MKKKSTHDMVYGYKPQDHIFLKVDMVFVLIDKGILFKKFCHSEVQTIP